MSTSPPSSRSSRFATLVLPVVLAGTCLWLARPTVPTTAAGASSPGVQSVTLSLERPAPVLTSLPSGSPKLITRPIEHITPGMRVLASNPEQTETLADANVTPESWRLVSLQMQKETGGTLHVQLLRPVDWLITEAVVLIGSTENPQAMYENSAGHRSPDLAPTAAPGTPDFTMERLLLGQSIHLDLPELGAQGPATVTAIDPCPPIDAPEPGRRLVTGTFRHSAANVIDLQVGSENEPFGCTDNHPFWSLDRQQFVEAGQLQIGEQLQTADGTVTQVTRITPRRGPPVEVYNFEVDAEHVYHVGTSGILVHNACHHYWPRWLGSQVPYGHSTLTPMSSGDHSALHTALRQFLQNRSPHLMHGAGNSGQQIQAANRLRDRLGALDDFYSTYENGAHYNNFAQEVLSTMLSGIYQ